MHTTEIKPDELPSKKEHLMEQVEACKESLPSDTYSQLYKYIDSLL